MLSYVKLNVEQLTAIRTACPNAAIDARHKEFDTASMVAMGESASYLYIGWSHTEQNLDRIGNACPNLTSCYFITCYATLVDVRALFEPPKRKLERIEVQFFAGEAVLQALSEKRSSLKEFHYVGEKLPSHFWASFVA